MATDKRSYLMDESPIPMSPSVAAALGDREAILLQQVHFWICLYREREQFLPVELQRHFFNDRWWIYNTLDAWKKQLYFWKPRSVERYFESLREQGVLLTCQPDRAWGNHTLWYAIDYDRLDELVLAWRLDFAKMAKSSIPPNWRNRFSQNGVISITSINQTSINQLPDPETPSASPELGLAPEPTPGAGERSTNSGSLYAGIFEYIPPVELALDAIEEKPDNGHGEMIYTPLGGKREPFQRRKRHNKGGEETTPAYSTFERAVLKAGTVTEFTKTQAKTVKELESAMVRAELYARKNGKAVGYPSMEFLNGAILWAYRNGKAVNQLIAAMQNMNNWKRQQAYAGKGGSREIEYESSANLTNE